MTVEVAEAGGKHRALVPGDGGESFPCCEHGHPDAGSAALHAWKLTRAIARRDAKASG